MYEWALCLEMFSSFIINLQLMNRCNIAQILQIEPGPDNLQLCQIALYGTQKIHFRIDFQN